MATRSRQFGFVAAAIATVVMLGAGGQRPPWFLTARTGNVQASAGVPVALPAARVYHGHRLEPRGAVLHGGGPAGEASSSLYAAAIPARPPMLASSVVDLHDDLAAHFAQLRHDLDLADHAGERGLLVPEIGLTLNAGAADRHYEDSVARGLERERIQTLVRELQRLNRPVFLRPGFGFNGLESGYKPAAYAAAFRRIATAVRDAGLEQVALVWEWSPDAELELQEAGARESDTTSRWLAFYPGDDVVDWWGMDLFTEPGISRSLTTDFLAEAELRGFPVMIAASTPRGHDTSEGSLLLETWFRPYFARLAGSPAIKAFTYLDRNWRAYPQWTDWGDGRVEADPFVLGYVRAQMASPVFAGLQSRAGTERLLGVSPMTAPQLVAGRSLNGPGTKVERSN